MREITYRSATTDDIVGIKKLWREFWPEQPYESNLESKIQRDPDLVYVAEMDKEIIGTTIGGFDGWWGWIYRVAVMPSSQNRGIATRLIEEMQTRLEVLGAKSANLIISPSNQRIHHIVQKLGYREMPDKRFSLGL